ncbi:MAG TPA: ribosome assembly RNA-binding protein YhbY [Spirochaetota bacterium]|nr:ribosome assembly RNA-binding protein YhbY [Spirochaetota bacterium]HPF06146.1 ribosome assembly RNA-binding protein YhbY [Spirochaetota bacterium]HPJ41316.1 ribosome assembly RNA-binding protein YhbY [Spirochaetota bacterium]HPR37051.1 ribosome assembly RNA-binding protein YhbY [Spirochaetota bacterium]HRX46675.1 ribosome assembly RNA-binding protein YhbY [Spirochaetota bacterium]
MTELNGRQRRKLKSLAHHLNPVVQIGQKGLTEALIKAVDKALSDHELIKVKFVDFKEEKHDLADDVVKETGSALVGMIGNIAILYRENPELERKERINPGQ